MSLCHPGRIRPDDSNRSAASRQRTYRVGVSGYLVQVNWLSVGVLYEALLLAFALFVAACIGLGRTHRLGEGYSAMLGVHSESLSAATVVDTP